MSDNTSPNLRLALVQPLTPSLKAGAATGIAGFLVGGGVGILRSAHPGIAAAYTGIQCFVLGGSFLYTRQAILNTAFTEKGRRADLVSSTAAGVISGAAAGSFYGRVNTVAGALLLGTVSHLGQRYIHRQADIEPKEKDHRPFLDKLAYSKWIPFKPISNTEYEGMLNEKLIKIDAEISMIDERIYSLRQGQSDALHKTDKS